MWKERLAVLRADLERGESTLDRERRARLQAEARAAELTAALELERHARAEAEARAEAASTALVQAHSPGIRRATRRRRRRRILRRR